MTEKEEKYRLVCRKEIENLLRGKFMQIDPNEEDDANLIIETDIRSKVSTFEGQSFCSHVNQFCSLFAIDGVDTEVWEQLPSGEVYVEGLSIHPYNYKGKDKVWAPFNQFQYPMVLDKGLGTPFQESDAAIASSVDGKHEDEYIKTREGHMFFYSYYIGSVTKFNQQRPCFRLYSWNQHENWDTLLTLWKYYNLHICQVIRSVDETKLQNYWLDYEGNRITLRDMIIGYTGHLNLHLEQIHELIEQ